MSLPYTGLTIQMVAKELGEKSSKLSDLCTSKNINLFAWRKPFAYAANKVELDDYQAWRGRAYGFQMVVQKNKPESGQEMDEMYYNPPSGGTEQPFRLGDFRGYSHNAKSPITMNITTEFDSIKPTVCKLKFSQLDGQLTLSEIFNTQNIYLAFIYVNANRIRVITTDKAIKDLDRAEQTLELPSAQDDAGLTTDLYVCMVLKKFEDYQDLNEWSSLNGCFPLNFPNYHEYHKSFVVQASPKDTMLISSVFFKAVHHVGISWIVKPLITYRKADSSQQTVTFNAADYYLDIEHSGYNLQNMTGGTVNQIIVNNMTGEFSTIYYEGEAEIESNIYFRLTEHSYDSTNYPKGDFVVRVYRKKDDKNMCISRIDLRDVD